MHVVLTADGRDGYIPNSEIFIGVIRQKRNADNMTNDYNVLKYDEDKC